MSEHPRKIGNVQVIDMATGEVVERRSNAMTLLPCSPGVCQECASDHAHDQPHNQESVYYQMRFRGTHGRWPTWSDAMSHCSPEVRAMCRATLVSVMREHGLEIPPDLLSEESTNGGR